MFKTHVVTSVLDSCIVCFILTKIFYFTSQFPIQSQIAEALNNYFICLGLADKQTTTQNKEYTSYLCDKSNSKLVFNSITEESVWQIIDNLKPKTSTGVDGISNKLLKFVKCV